MSAIEEVIGHEESSNGILTKRRRVTTHLTEDLLYVKLTDGFIELYIGYADKNGAPEYRVGHRMTMTSSEAEHVADLLRDHAKKLRKQAK